MVGQLQASGAALPEAFRRIHPDDNGTTANKESSTSPCNPMPVSSKKQTNMFGDLMVLFCPFGKGTSIKRIKIMCKRVSELGGRAVPVDDPHKYQHPTEV